MRPAIAHRHAEALAVTQGHVGSPLARRRQQHQGQQIGGGDNERAGGVGLLGECAIVVDVAVGGRILHQHAEGRLGEVVLLVMADDDLDTQRFGAGAHDGQRLRVDEFGDEEDVGVGAAGPRALAEGHGLGRGRTFVQQRGVGDLQAGQVSDHRLEVDQRFQPALGDFGLVGRIGGVPAGVLQDVALDDRRGDGVMIAHADV